MWDHLSTIAAVGSFLWAVATMVAGYIFRNAMLQVKGEIGKTELRLTTAISNARTEIDRRIEVHIQDIEEQLDAHRRDTGEMGLALRTKIHEVETWARDNFVRGGTFNKVTSELSSQIGELGKRIEGRLERMEDKIDGKVMKGHES